MTTARKLLNEFDFAVKRPIGRIARQRTDRGDYHDGLVLTQHGIVNVYAQGDKNEGRHFSRLDFGWQGRCYVRSFQNKRLTPRGLVTAADRFAREIAGEKP